VRAAVVGGTVAGLLDLAGAIAVYWPASPAAILRSIAAGLVGPATARAGGAGVAALGLAAHFTIALGTAAVFVAASRRAPILVGRPWISGPVYGAVVFLVMNYAVIPWSAIGRAPGPWTTTTWLVLAVHLFGVGLPIALAARRWAVRG